MPCKPSETPRRLLGYKVRYCAEVVAFMAKGYSLTAFAGEIGETRATLTRWCETHPAFAIAVGRAQARRARLLEDKMLAAKGAGAFGVHMQALKTAAPDEWNGDVGKGRSNTPLLGETHVDLPDNTRE